ncbi:unnamed protein product [Paramecium sonneborni]|uniref:Uncharacterized protein n=1 Tax=Paramecium sonneborni TaxID=65129 RepID=A0A8S1QDB3_9CILI|nr:unnamed protein product [Paramecium sonneborni]
MFPFFQINPIMNAQEQAKLLSKKVETYYLDLKNQLLIFQTLKLQFNFYLILLTFLQNDLSTKKILIKFHQSYLDKFQNNIHLEMVQLADKVQIKKQWWLVTYDQLNDLQIEIDTRVENQVNIFKAQPISATDLVQLISFHLSQTFKGANISLSGQNMIAEEKTSESKGQRFINCEPSKNGVYKFGFKVIKYGGWIEIGVCQGDIIASSNYKFNYTNIGHGYTFIKQMQIIFNIQQWLLMVSLVERFKFSIQIF